MPYCLVCLASGTKDPCVRCGHRPSKRVEQLVHLRLKSIYKAFKQSGASVGSSDSLPRSSGGGAHSGTAKCTYASNTGSNKTGRDASTIGGKYSSTLRSLAENDSAGTQNSEKDKVGSFDQSMANEVAAVLQTASNAMSGNNADGDVAGNRQSKGSRASSSHDGGRERGRTNSASERYYRKTQAELEAAAAAAEADAEAAAAALLAELDEEDASAVSKKKKKKKRKEKKKEAAADGEKSKAATEKKTSLPLEKKTNEAQKPSMPKKTVRDSDDDSSDDDINFEQIVGRTKGSTKTSKKKDKKDVEVEVKVVVPPPISKPKVEAPHVETNTTDFDKELAILLSSDDEQGLETFLDKLRGVPGLGAARKTAKKALKRIKEAKASDSFETDEPLFENKTGVIVVENERKSAKNTNKSVSQGQSSRAKNVISSSNSTSASPVTLQEPLLRVVSKTPSNKAPTTSRGVASNSVSATASARGECVMHMSPLVVGWVIGKGGQRIRDMMEESGAKIWIDQESMAADEARVVYVSGKRSSVDSAVRMVKDLVAKAPFAGNSAQSPPSNKVESPSPTSTTVHIADPAEEPPSFAAAIASAPTPSVPPKEGSRSKRGWAASHTQNVVVLPGESHTNIDNSFQSEKPAQSPVAPSNLPPTLDDVKKEFTCHAHVASQLLADGMINLIRIESGASVTVDHSGVVSKIVIHGQSANVDKAELFLRNAITGKSGFDATRNRNFDSVDANSVMNLTQGFRGVSLSSPSELSLQSIPPGYAHDSQRLPQPPLLNSKSQTLDSSIQGSKPLENWASQNRSILPQFPPNTGVSDEHLGTTDPRQSGSFGVPGHLSQSPFSAISQQPLQSIHVLPERIQRDTISGLNNNGSGLSNNNFVDNWNSQGERDMQFETPLFSDSQTPASTLGTIENDDSQMVDNMFASLGALGGGLLSGLDSSQQTSWGSLSNWGDNTSPSPTQQFSGLDSLLESSLLDNERNK